MTRLNRIFYGWWILGACSVVASIVSATQSYGFSLFFVPLIAEFGWSRAALSGVMSLARLEGGFLGPIEGILVDRFGPRRMMLIGIPIIGVGFFCMSQLSEIAAALSIDTLLAFYGIWVLLIAGGTAIGTSTPAQTAVANWFVRRRGLALGLYSSSIGVGAASLVPFLAHIIETDGWRVAALVAGVTAVGIGIPAALLVRHRPEDHGYLPDGDTQPLATAATSSLESTRTVEHNFTMRQALATQAFWVLAFAFGFRVMVTSAVIIHLPALLQDMGFGAVEAASAVSAVAALSVAGRLGLGWLGDRGDKRSVYIGALAAMAGALLLLAFAAEAWHIVAFLVLYSPAYGGLASLQLALRGDYFGRRAFATIAGAMGPITTVGTITGPLLAGLAFDLSGSYRIAMLFFAAATAVNIMLMAVLRQPHIADQQA
ncbi:MAG: MFS transporter [Dehalococcoidia bacterium]|nr:MFS transporter [Dehalococcoidia bacterium]